MNGWTALVLAGVLAVFLIHVAADLLDLRRLRRPLPGHVSRLYPTEVRQRSTEYARLRLRASVAGEALDLGAVLIFWFAGGFAWLDALVRGWGWGPVVPGLAFLGVLAGARLLIGLPMRIHAVFGIEGRFGFNRTTPALFALDLAKGLVLTVVLGVPLVAGFILLFTFGGWWAWVVSWAAVGVLLVIMQIVVPAIVMPWFNTFLPLESGTLSRDIAAMAERAGFPVRSVAVMDGSRRTTKANAFFVGIGRRRRIALYDTLLERYSTDEILGVLAHEIGHYRLGHVRLGVAVSALEAGLLLFLFSRLGQLPELSQAFEVAEPSVYAGIVFFTLLIRPLELMLSVGQLALSRHNERAADAFASRLAEGSSGLGLALLQLYRESLGELWPHPLIVALDYSHPPLVARLRALSQKGAD